MLKKSLKIISTVIASVYLFTSIAQADPVINVHARNLSVPSFAQGFTPFIEMRNSIDSVLPDTPELAVFKDYLRRGLIERLNMQPQGRPLARGLVIERYERIESIINSGDISALENWDHFIQGTERNIERINGLQNSPIQKKDNTFGKISNNDIGKVSFVALFSILILSFFITGFLKDGVLDFSFIHSSISLFSYLSFAFFMVWEIMTCRFDYLELKGAFLSHIKGISTDEAIVLNILKDKPLIQDLAVIKGVRPVDLVIQMKKHPDFEQLLVDTEKDYDLNLSVLIQMIEDLFSNQIISSEVEWGQGDEKFPIIITIRFAETADEWRDLLIGLDTEEFVVGVWLFKDVIHTQRGNALFEIKTEDQLAQIKKIKDLDKYRVRNKKTYYEKYKDGLFSAFLRNNLPKVSGFLSFILGYQLFFSFVNSEFFMFLFSGLAGLLSWRIGDQFCLVFDELQKPVIETTEDGMKTISLEYDEHSGKMSLVENKDINKKEKVTYPDSSIRAVYKEARRRVFEEIIDAAMDDELVNTDRLVGANLKWRDLNKAKFYLLSLSKVGVASFFGVIVIAAFILSGVLSVTAPQLSVVYSSVGVISLWSAVFLLNMNLAAMFYKETVQDFRKYLNISEEEHAKVRSNVARPKFVRMTLYLGVFVKMVLPVLTLGALFFLHEDLVSGGVSLMSALLGNGGVVPSSFLLSLCLLYISAASSMVFFFIEKVISERVSIYSKIVKDTKNETRVRAGVYKKGNFTVYQGGQDGFIHLAQIAPVILGASILGLAIFTFKAYWIEIVVSSMVLGMFLFALKEWAASKAEPAVNVSAFETDDFLDEFKTTADFIFSKEGISNELISVLTKNSLVQTIAGIVDCDAEELAERLAFAGLDEASVSVNGNIALVSLLKALYKNGYIRFFESVDKGISMKVVFNTTGLPRKSILLELINSELCSWKSVPMAYDPIGDPLSGLSDFFSKDNRDALIVSEFIAEEEKPFYEGLDGYVSAIKTDLFPEKINVFFDQFRSDLYAIKKNIAEKELEKLLSERAFVLSAARVFNARILLMEINKYEAAYLKLAMMKMDDKSGLIRAFVSFAFDQTLFLHKPFSAQLGVVRDRFSTAETRNTIYNDMRVMAIVESCERQVLGASAEVSISRNLQDFYFNVTEDAADEKRAVVFYNEEPVSFDSDVLNSILSEKRRLYTVNPKGKGYVLNEMMLVDNNPEIISTWECPDFEAAVNLVKVRFADVRVLVRDLPKVRKLLMKKMDFFSYGKNKRDVMFDTSDLGVKLLNVVFQDREVLNRLEGESGLLRKQGTVWTFQLENLRGVKGSIASSLTYVLDNLKKAFKEKVAARSIQTAA